MVRFRSDHADTAAGRSTQPPAAARHGVTVPAAAIGPPWSDTVTVTPWPGHPSRVPQEGPPGG
eukprot:176596-Hanusia_phi.AAC.1